MMLCGSLRLEWYVKVFLDLSKSRCRSSCVLSAGVEWRVYTLRYSRWWNSPDQSNKCHSLSKRFRLWSRGNPRVSSSHSSRNASCLPSSPHAKNPNIPFQRLLPPAQLQNPPFLQCSSILLSPEPLFLLPQARRPQGIQRCHPRLPQARRPWLTQACRQPPLTQAHQSTLPVTAPQKSPPSSVGEVTFKGNALQYCVTP